jgi:hypothetical protein
MKVWKLDGRGKKFTVVNLSFGVLDLELLDISMFSQAKRWLP